jgi:hypothetical protein
LRARPASPRNAGGPCTGTASRRRARRAAALACICATLAGCAAERDAAQPDGEHLIAAPPAGWSEVSALNQGNLRIAEYVDPEQVTPDRVDSVRFESQASAPLPDPIDFLLGMREELKSQCQGVRDFPIFSGLENGYPTSVRLLLCRQKGDPPRGEVRMIKAIQGAEQFYIVSRSRSTPPFAPEAEPMSVEDMALWSTWLGGVKLCDTRGTAHPCPAADGVDEQTPAAGEDAGAPQPSGDE